MGWSAAGLVIVGKSTDELREVMSDRFAETGPISGYQAESEFGPSSFAVGQSDNVVALWDPIGKLAFGPRGEELRCALSKGTKLVAFQMSSAEGKYGLRVYEDGESVRVIEVQGGQPVQETGPVLAAEAALPRRAGIDEDWIFAVLHGLTGVAFEELGAAPYELLEV